MPAYFPHQRLLSHQLSLNYYIGGLLRALIIYPKAESSYFNKRKEVRNFFSRIDEWTDVKRRSKLSIESQRLLEESNLDPKIQDVTLFFITSQTESDEIDLEEIEEEFEIESQMLNEVAAKRKIVVRKGKKRIIFKCAPGLKKKGPRTCVRRVASQLRKMKLTAKRSSRKARGKRAQAGRKRKLSLRKRLTFGLRPRKKK